MRRPEIVDPGPDLNAPREQPRPWKNGSMHGGQPQKEPSFRSRVLLKNLGITFDQSANWQKLAQIPEPDFEASIAALKDGGASISTGALLVEPTFPTR